VAGWQAFSEEIGDRSTAAAAAGAAAFASANYRYSISLNGPDRKKDFVLSLKDKHTPASLQLLHTSDGAMEIGIESM
jgi:hypothetical protein